jgi:hypothetical protein
VVEGKDVWAHVTFLTLLLFSISLYVTMPDQDDIMRKIDEVSKHSEKNTREISRIKYEAIKNIEEISKIEDDLIKIKHEAIGKISEEISKIKCIEEKKNAEKISNIRQILEGEVKIDIDVHGLNISNMEDRMRDIENKIKISDKISETKIEMPQ